MRFGQDPGETLLIAVDFDVPQMADLLADTQRLAGRAGPVPGREIEAAGRAAPQQATKSGRKGGEVCQEVVEIGGHRLVLAFLTLGAFVICQRSLPKRNYLMVPLAFLMRTCIKPASRPGSPDRTLSKTAGVRTGLNRPA